jgi:hypothetical protein
MTPLVKLHSYANLLLAIISTASEAGSEMEISTVERSVSMEKDVYLWLIKSLAEVFTLLVFLYVMMC